MKRIMFVCHGNICRSPMAQMIFDDIIMKNHLESEFEVFSSATSYEEIGNPVYPPARRIIIKKDIPFKEHFSTKLYPDDYGKYDMFIVMDENNLRNIKRIFTSDPDGKIYKLLSFAGSGSDVCDPYYSGDFQRAFDDIYTGCKALFESVKRHCPIQ